ncbi:hypothetical protein KIV10_09325 [Aequorivita echinoideorum]|uniref:Uncharacterized protein n=1 Tax=Aequorivita echinoideorum TaxID=1549647 RepID=A0ABS5S5A2_9FLAO|nr:hypothetical protein [Aequorivita echinoideorum]MBT0608381.1 hypothetical protein [Aequorivita echinoideorum]
MQHIPKQPRTLVSYWNVNKLLYSALLLFIVETVYYYYGLYDAYQHAPVEIILFWVWCLLFSFVHIFLVLMDGWSRFQNYKRIKDHLFQHGFTPKIAKHYSGSKCQRMAVIAAAKELGMEDSLKRYYYKMGIRWYNFIPQFMLRDPLFLFKKYFWSRTFLEKYYEPKFDFKQYQNKLSECYMPRD